MFKKSLFAVSFVFLICSLPVFSLETAEQSGAKNVSSETVQVNAQTKPKAPTIYENKCSFCHQPKPMNALANAQAWIKLLYTTGCPQVNIAFTETERKAMKQYIDAQFQPKK